MRSVTSYHSLPLLLLLLLPCLAKELARHMQQPRETDWMDLTRVARYLWHTRDWVAVSRVDPGATQYELVVECDADWAGG